MKQALPLFALVLGSLAGVHEPATGQQAGRTEISDLRATVQQLRAELDALRKVVARLEIERHHDNLQRIKAELESVRAEQARLAELDRSRQQDLAELEDLIARNASAPEQQPDIQALRAELALDTARHIADQSEAVKLRERELVRRLETEEQHYNRLDQALKSRGGK